MGGSRTRPACHGQCDPADPSDPPDSIPRCEKGRDAANRAVMSMEFNPDQLVTDALAGSADAFLQLVRYFSPSVRAQIAAQVFNLSEVDDLAQDVFISAHRRLHTFRVGEDFGAWLRGITRNKLLTHFRTVHRRHSAYERFQDEVREAVGDAWTPDSAEERREGIQALLRCIAKLPERMRRVVHAGLEGARAQALADEMGTSPGAIYQLQYRANQLLRDCVKQETGHAT